MMKRATVAACIIAALTIAAAGIEFAAAARAHEGVRGGRLVRTTMLVPKIAPQSRPPAASQAQPAQPHPSMAPPQARPMPRAPFSPGGFPHHGGFPHYHSYVAPPIVVPRYVPPPAYYGYGSMLYAPPPSYYDYGQPAYAAPPPAYVERSDDYWYYCAPLGAYYPDVNECPEPWIPVPQQ
jgi:hypothetical protein